MVKGKRAAGPKRKRGVRKARAKRTSNVRDFASLSVNRTYAVAGGGPPVANTMYSIMNTALDQYQRAINAAQAYQFYRIKNISLKIKPQFDTYAFGTVGYGKPKLYYIFDKSGALPTTINVEAMKQMGARPHNLDEKPLTISWAPSVLTADMSAPGGAPIIQAAQYKISPWLNTSANTISLGVWTPNSVDHLGVYFWVDATSFGGTGGLPYQVDVEVQFEFKKPLWTSTGSTVATSLVPAVLDASPDGVEGGSDGITIPLTH